VFEDTFKTQQVMHTPLEPMVSVAEPDAGMGTLTVYTASQSPSFVRIEIARLLGWDENRVRVKSALLGGGFLLFIDTLARTAAPVDIPLGILTAVIGTPFFIWLLADMQRSWS